MITVEEASQSLLDSERSRWQNGEIAQSTFRSVRSRVNTILDLVDVDSPVNEINTDSLQDTLSQEYSESSVRDIVRLANRMQDRPTEEDLETILSEAREELETTLSNLNETREEVRNNLTRINAVLKARNS